jgi:hypothetical protein
LNFLNASSIRALDSGSLVMVLDADVEPISRPSSPPKKTPATERKV